jgi:hypothetical protein
MRKPVPFALIILLLFLGSCGMMESIVKSSFPYTATLVIPASSKVGKSYSAVSLANSFDQNFSKKGNNADKVSEVTIISAKLQSTEPSDFNLGDLKSVSIYMSKENEKEEVLVASRTDITAGVGNTMILDIDNSKFLDPLVREPDIRIKMIYELRKKTNVDVSLHLVLGLNAYPAK